MELSRRELRMLRAVADGRAEVSCSCEPDMRIDGLACCDQYTAHRLSELGLVRGVALATVGTFVRAELTSVGLELVRGAA